MTLAELITATREILGESRTNRGFITDDEITRWINESLYKASRNLEFLKSSVMFSTLADDDAGAGRVDVDADLVAGALDLDAADGGGLQLGHQGLADLPVLGEVVLVLALAEPAALPIGGDTETEPVRIDFLTHQFSSPFDSAVAVDSASVASVAAGAVSSLAAAAR